MSDDEPIPARPRWTSTGEAFARAPSVSVSASIDPDASATAGRVVLGVAPAAASTSAEPTSETVIVPDPAGPAEQLAHALADAWARGDRPRADELLADRPDLRDRPEVVARLIREEVAQRRALGLAVETAEFLARFPGWDRRLIALLDDGYPDHPAALGGEATPGSGETIGEFVVIGTLGRGARGSVVLATQPSLANRPVVLKATPREGWEHLSLARLQHPHIVPLLGVQEPAGSDLRLMVMPYHGGASLSRVLDLLADVPVASRRGRDLLDALGRADPAPPIDPVRADGPARRFLARASYAKAVGWIGACLADALDEAHRRGLLHLDLKPSNVLLAADGRPMLLDFHLARGPIPAGAVGLGRVGGTPSYMAPEQRAALDAARSGLPTPRDVDARADLFGLGALLHEALGGPVPLDAGPSRRRSYPGVEPGLAAIVSRCLADDPEARYPDAGHLAADLRRQLADLPLLGASHRNPLEHLRQWSRRRPTALARLA
ncbi:MAG TPA: serine/threonine-protein kinase, partial [Isosphaeraceae bacterium]|nr:serine/threonine-protein kinase [Isosphaeraceae bacterium]